MGSILSKYNRRVDRANSLLCVGLDSEVGQIPERFHAAPLSQWAFNQWVIEQTHPYVSAYKFNLAFYEARGDEGLRALKQTMDHLGDAHPEILTIGDAKRGDIGSTNEGYVTSLFDWFGFDAVTLNPYLGQEALRPFLERDDKVCIILCRTSNPGAGEFQDLEIDGKPLWQIVAEKVSGEWDRNGNCMLVAGATYPAELKEIRALVGDMTLLVPGIGAQGGNIERTVRAGLNAHHKGMIINSSRAIIFADKPEDSAQSFRDAINNFR
jgi:orotidine-5'-phosphate decarboxylase